MRANGRVIAVIPARYASSRVPGKPMVLLAGKPMIQWVYERASQAETVDEVVVATDHAGIRDTVEAFGGKAVMTSPDHASGTDRVAEAVAGSEGDLVVNVQGDEPLLPSDVIDSLVGAMRATGAEMGTVAVPIGLNSKEFLDPNVVKTILDDRGFALYFSRLPIPFCREGGTPVEPLWHWGIYAYRRDFLEQFVRWPQGRLERCEKLEQLRALEHGARIRVIVHSGSQSVGVDVPEDVAEVEELLRRRGEA